MSPIRSLVFSWVATSVALFAAGCDRNPNPNTRPVYEDGVPHHTHDAADIVSGVLVLDRIPQHSGSGLDADLLDGHDSSEFLKQGDSIDWTQITNVPDDFGSGLKQVAVQPPLLGAGTAQEPVSIPPATAQQPGYLTAEDYVAFASKVGSVTAGPGVVVTGSPNAPIVGAQFGSAAGTVAEGNDPRLSDDRNPLPNSNYYVQNGMPATGQNASFHIAGNGLLDGWLAANNAIRVGGIWDTAANPAGQGAKLYFSGAPDVSSQGDNENTDELYMARYNVAPDQTELHLSIGDNAGGGAYTGLLDKFIVGAHDYTAGYVWRPLFSVESTGTVRAKGAFVANTTPDLAETIDASPDVETADVVCADPLRKEHVVRCAAGQGMPMGVISDGSSSFLINAYGKSPDAELTGKPLVLAGRVPVKVSNENGAIRPGDLLSPSSVPGVAMRAFGPGAVVGIALEAFDARQARGQVLCFVKAGEGNVAAQLQKVTADYDALKAKQDALEKRLAALEQATRRR